MPAPTTPPDRSAGEAGHLADHVLINDNLDHLKTDVGLLDGRVTELEGGPPDPPPIPTDTYVETYLEGYN